MRFPRMKDLTAVGSASARANLAAYISGIKSMASSIDTTEMSPTAKAAVENAVRDASVEALARPAGGDLLSFGASVRTTNTDALGSDDNLFDLENENVVVSRWGLDDSQKLDRSILVTRYSIHISTQDDEDQPGANPLAIIALRDQLVMGRWQLRAGETGETLLGRGSVADYIDTEAIANFGVLTTDAKGITGVVVHQDLTDRAWQAAMIVPRNVPLSLNHIGADGDNAVTPAESHQSRLVYSFQGIKLPG